MLIAFAGCDGAGKSTQVKRVRQWLDDRACHAEIVDRWNILDRERFPECRFIRSSRNEVQVCNSEMEGLSRAMFLFWTVSVTMEELALEDSSRVYLIDSYWMKHAAAELEFGCDSTWIEATIRCLPSADLTFYLDIFPEEAWRRKPDVTPYECARNPSVNREDFIRHQTKLRSRLRRWADEFRWKVISSMQEPESVTEQIGSCLMERLCSVREESSRAKQRIAIPLLVENGAQ